MLRWERALEEASIALTELLLAQQEIADCYELLSPTARRSGEGELMAKVLTVDVQEMCDTIGAMNATHTTKTYEL